MAVADLTRGDDARTPTGNDRRQAVELKLHEEGMRRGEGTAIWGDDSLERRTGVHLLPDQGSENLRSGALARVAW